MMNKPITEIADELGRLLIAKQLILTTAESCTGGHIASTLCAAADTPLYFGAGFVTFNDDAKRTVLAVKKETLERFTAVSGQTVAEMAEGAVLRSGADISVAVSGYAGPEGGDDGTPAGTVWFAWLLPSSALHVKSVHFAGDCNAVIGQATHYALSNLLLLLKQHGEA